MKRVILVACLAGSLQACARNESGPSFLGMLPPVDAEASDAATAGQNANRPELRHVGSNRVLGAMAFQKVTGRAVDPSRLEGNR